MAGLTLGIISAATGLASFGMGIGQAAKQRRAQAKAERDSKKMMQEAKALASRNFYEKLQVPIGAYEKQFRENTAQQMQGIQALQEAGGRSLIGGIGKIHSQATAANQDTTNALAEALYSNDLQKAKAAQEMNDMLIDIEVGGAADESRRARDANRIASESMASGIEGLTGALDAASEIIPLYSKSKKNKNTTDFTPSTPQEDAQRNSDLNDLAQQANTKLEDLVFPPLKRTRRKPVKSVKP